MRTYSTNRMTVCLTVRLFFFFIIILLFDLQIEIFLKKQNIFSTLFFLCRLALNNRCFMKDINVDKQNYVRYIRFRFFFCEIFSSNNLIFTITEHLLNNSRFISIFCLLYFFFLFWNLFFFNALLLMEVFILVIQIQIMTKTLKSKTVLLIHVGGVTETDLSFNFF